MSIIQERYVEENKNVLNFLKNVLVFDCSWRSAGKEFHAHGQANENARSPTFSAVLGTSQRRLLADWRA